jgi:hypothetical protein
LNIFTGCRITFTNSDGQQSTYALEIIAKPSVVFFTVFFGKDGLERVSATLSLEQAREFAAELISAADRAETL